MNGLEYVIQIAVISILVVLVALLLLYILFYIFGLLFYRGDKKEAPQKAVPAAKSLAALQAEESGPDGRVKAAIMGALYSYMQTEAGDVPAANLLFTVAPEGAGGMATWKLRGRQVLLNQRKELETIRRKKQRENI